MGLLDRLRGGSDAPGRALGLATITGIRGRSNDDTDTRIFRVEWDDGTPREGAIEFGSDAPVAVRLGAQVLLRAAGRGVELDVEAMASAPVAPGFAGIPARKVPDRGIDDKAVEWRARRRLTSWTPARAVVESWTRGTMFGVPTDNFDVVFVTGATTATASRSEVLSYVRWFVHPGAEVPVVIDPSDATSAQLDWITLAQERAGGRWDDAPPEGSIAAVARARASAEPTAGVDDGPLDLTPSAASSEAIEGVTLDQWALVQAALVRDRVAPARHDDYASEHYGVAPGRWTAIVDQWNQRMRSDWRVGTAFGEAYERAQRALKGEG